MQLLKNKRILGLVVVLIVAGLGYYVWSSAGGSGALLTDSSAGGTSPISQEILAALSSLNNIKLDKTIFEDPIFLSLTDHSEELPHVNSGRRNPFAPIGASSPLPTDTAPLSN